ncbi:Extracellular calcium-sensing receptor [Varanus komodoensis]|nr:Extracellular calcium-sensing receptor [Varanus komodoensis]
MEEGVNSLLIKFSDDTKTGAVATTEEQVLQIQKDLDRLWKRAGDNRKTFNVDKCKVLHLGQRNTCHKYRWTWVGLCASDDDKGQRFLQTMVPMLAQNLICDAFILRIPKCDYVDQLIEVMLQHRKSYNTVIQSKANVVFVYGEPPSFQMLSMLLFLAPFLDLPPLGKVCITTSHWDFASHALQKMWDMQTFHDSMSFSVHANQLLGFQRFMQAVRPSWTKEDGFIQDFWEQTFSCLLKLSDGRQKDKVTCSGGEKLENLPGSFFEIKMTGHSYNVYNAAYAVAHALHAIYETSSKHRRLAERESPAHQNVQPWQVRASKHILMKAVLNFQPRSKWSYTSTLYNVSKKVVLHAFDLAVLASVG